MLDVAIIGAGLCGLSLARELVARGHAVQVFEARERLGGRALTVRCPDTGAPLDLGPTWFWPETEPRITALLAELGLETAAQHDSGRTLVLADPNRAPEALARDGVHGGARRLRDGAEALVQALAAGLPDGTVRAALALRSATDRGTHVELLFEPHRAHAGAPPALQHRVLAHRVVLALPPRLVRETIAFDPPLPDAVQEALADTPTWMATQAKSLATYARPFWRDSGLSGNAFVSHRQAVLAEVFDASPEHPPGGPGVLGGFSALTPAYRRSARRSLPLLVESQWAQLFGPEAATGARHNVDHDWATEAWTCSAADLADTETPQDSHAPMRPPGWGDPLLRRPQWGARLHFAGTETATTGAGHMEGALDAAARTARALDTSSRASPVSPQPQPSAPALQDFADWVHAQRALALGRYRSHVHQRLSTQRQDALTQHALLAAAEQLYSLALGQLDALALDLSGSAIEQGRHALTPAVLAPFSGFSKALVEAAVAFNGTSCALSNFPDEAHPAPDYLDAIARDLAAAWREFALGVNDHLLSRTPTLHVSP